MGDSCFSPVGNVIGRCVVRELDDVQVGNLGKVFADVSVIQLDNNVVADNSVQIVDSNGRQLTCRFQLTLYAMLLTSTSISRTSLSGWMLSPCSG